VDAYLGEGLPREGEAVESKPAWIEPGATTTPPMWEMIGHHPFNPGGVQRGCCPRYRTHPSCRSGRRLARPALGALNEAGAERQHARSWRQRREPGIKKRRRGGIRNTRQKLSSCNLLSKRSAIQPHQAPLQGRSSLSALSPDPCLAWRPRQAVLEPQRNYPRRLLPEGLRPSAPRFIDHLATFFAEQGSPPIPAPVHGSRLAFDDSAGHYE